MNAYLPAPRVHYAVFLEVIKSQHLFEFDRRRRFARVWVCQFESY